MKRLFFLSIYLILFNACTPSSSPTQWKVVYKNDKKGNQLVGNKEALVNAIRNGASVKIAWGAKGKNHRIEHVSHPIWLAILDETEVIAHLNPQVLSNINWDELTATYSDSTKLKEEWRVVITTKGTFDAIWYNREEDQLIKRVPQNHIISWMVKDGNNENSPKPFFEE